MTKIGQTGPRNKPDIAGTDHYNAH
jgi:hypothetical protein